jgi:hypothetical protein
VVARNLPHPAQVLERPQAQLRRISAPRLVPQFRHGQLKVRQFYSGGFRGDRLAGRSTRPELTNEGIDKTIAEFDFIALAIFFIVSLDRAANCRPRPFIAEVAELNRRFQNRRDDRTQLVQKMKRTIAHRDEHVQIEVPSRKQFPEGFFRRRDRCPSFVEKVFLELIEDQK